MHILNIMLYPSVSDTRWDHGVYGHFSQTSLTVIVVLYKRNEKCLNFTVPGRIVGSQIAPQLQFSPFLLWYISNILRQITACQLLEVIFILK